ncbi:lipopolysaccharide biosynthesis protein [Clostridium paraputrificum]|uniref:lipopolysaccharide biosynthesis protein n=1 Tax=Clostridium TaxID=1485 RepID=UPI003D352FDD
MELTKGKVLKDLILNILGSFVLTGTLQLIIYPLLGYKMSQEEYGRLLTLIGMSNAIGGILGNSLNNIKLLHQNDYEENDLKDFGILIKNMVIATVILTAGVVILYKDQISLINAIILIFATVFIVLRCYISVYYRIRLDYLAMLKQVVATVIGYVVGIAIFFIIPLWPIVFLLGELAAFLYAYFTTDFKYEKKEKSEKYNIVVKDFMQISLSNSVANLLLYLDRIIINPVLGASNVAVYFVASLVGKTAGIVLNPLSTIILTYLAKMKDSSSKKSFMILSLSSVVMGLTIFLVSIPLTPIIIKILYPNDYLAASPFFNLANLSVIIMICGSLINPLLLKNSPLYWQNIIQVIYGVLYIGGSTLLMQKYQLFGFCLAGIIANGIRMLLIWSIAFYYIFMGKEKEIES